MLDANFWQDKANSKNIVKEKKLFEDLINSLNDTEIKIQELSELNNLAIQENNQEIQNEVLVNTKELGETALMFLIHPTLTKDEIQQTCNAITSVMNLATA